MSKEGNDRYVKFFLKKCKQFDDVHRSPTGYPKRCIRHLFDVNTILDLPVLQVAGGENISDR